VVCCHSRVAKDTRSGVHRLYRRSTKLLLCLDSDSDSEAVFNERLCILNPKLNILMRCQGFVFVTTRYLGNSEASGSDELESSTCTHSSRQPFLKAVRFTWTVKSPSFFTEDALSRILPAKLLPLDRRVLAVLKMCFWPQKTQ
jgi:hypothetical protein